MEEREEREEREEDDTPTSKKRARKEVASSRMMKDKVKKDFEELFEEYKLKYETLGNATPSSSSSTCSSKQHVSSSQSSSTTFLIDQFNSRYRSGGRSEYVKSELEKYLTDELEEEKEGVDDLMIYGPRDSSVLTAQATHRSTNVCREDVDTILTVRHGIGPFWSFDGQLVQLHPRLVCTLYQMRFYGVACCGQIEAIWH
ncbi:hypothetical protein DH2020_021832 [Rehmannia glutinosa]|uniref:Uncharacterized protein n=1 Tax=Rehmannia glutinosa TaxID=99300 RepID=A0ABR0WC54_REHGL